MYDRPSTITRPLPPFLPLLARARYPDLVRMLLLNLVLKVWLLNKVGNLIVVRLLLALLHALVALGELAQRGKRIGSELVQDTGDELGQLLVLTVAVDGEGVGGNSGVNCWPIMSAADSSDVAALRWP